MLASENKVAVILPTFTSHTVFWATISISCTLLTVKVLPAFISIFTTLGVDSQKFKQELKQAKQHLCLATRLERVIPDLAVQIGPISADEIAQKDYRVRNLPCHIHAGTSHPARHLLSSCSGKQGT